MHTNTHASRDSALLVHVQEGHDKQVGLADHSDYKAGSATGCGPAELWATVWSHHGFLLLGETGMHVCACVCCVCVCARVYVCVHACVCVLAHAQGIHDN